MNSSIGGEMDKIKDLRITGWRNGRIHGLLDGGMEESMDYWIEGWKEEFIDYLMEGWKNSWITGWKDGRIHRLLDGRIHGLLDGRMEEFREYWME